MSIYITGDTHREIDYAKVEKFMNDNPNLTKEDYIITHLCDEYALKYIFF